MSGSRILITGSRGWTDQATIRAAMIRALADFPDDELVTLVTGGCPTGADKLAETVWATLSAGPTETHPADWYQHGHRAGYLRNKHMIDLGADLCLAFLTPCTKPGCTREPTGHDSHGTAMTIDIARKAGIPVRIHRQGPQ